MGTLTVDTPDTPGPLPGHDLHVELEVHRGAAGTVHVVRLAGDLELPSAPRLDAALGVTPQGRRPGRAPAETPSAPVADPPDALVLDLTEVTFIDSTGLGAVLKAYRRVRDAGGAFVLVGPPEQTRALLEVTGATHVVPVHPTLASALAELLHPSA